MSDSWIVLIPEDPHYVPESAAQVRAKTKLAELAPGADEVTAKVNDQVQFFDCGENFSRVFCPSCNAEISMEWWQAKMGEDWSDGFKLNKFAVPCCGNLHTLHELVYDWPQGFGLFSLEAMNPLIGELLPEPKAELEVILGTRLRLIYQHI